MSDLSPIDSSHLPLTEPSPATPHTPNTIFRGPDGIRVGWRVVIYLLISAGLFLLLVSVAALFLRGRLGQLSQLTPLGTLLSEGLIFVLAAIPAWIMSRIERRTWDEYGLPLKSAFGGDFWIGGLIGFAAISACLLAIFLLHGFHLTGLAIHGSTIPIATISWVVAFIVVGLAEEFSFRGYLQYTLSQGIGFWPTAILLSVLFGLAHAGNPGESKAGLASVVCFALLFCLFLKRTGNLWLPVGFHFGWDWGQTFFYGVPDSGLLPYHNLFNCSFSGPTWLTGGSVGPEASVFTPIVLAIVAIIFASVRRDSRYVIRASKIHHAEQLTTGPASETLR